MNNKTLQIQRAALNRWNNYRKKDQEFIEKNKEGNEHFLARIHGYLSGDGCVMKRTDSSNGIIRYSVLFYPDDEKVCANYLEALKRLYNKTPRVKEEKNHFCIRFDSKVIAEDILKISKVGTLSWEVPFKLLKDEKCKIEWLKSFFDSEGYISPAYVQAQSVNKKGLEQVQMLLQEFDIDSRIYTYKRKNKNWNTNYLLNINKIASRIRFFKKIGFMHSRKHDKLNQICLSKGMS